jgi:hypothetical protein
VHRAAHIVVRYSRKSEQALLNAFFVSLPTMTPSGSFDLMMRWTDAIGSDSTSGTGAVGTISSRARFCPTVAATATSAIACFAAFLLPAS